MKLESGLVTCGKVGGAHTVRPNDLDVRFKKITWLKRARAEMFTAAIVGNGNRLSNGMDELWYISI